MHGSPPRAVAAALAWCTLLSASLGRPPRPDVGLPYRFLVVISEQWKDPASYVVDGSGEFQTLAALLKSWGLPFEILRLDQQRLDKYHLLDRDGHPRYGTIIWNAGGPGIEGKGLELLSELAKHHGVNLVVLGDGVATPEISDLAGVRYVSDYISGEGLAVTHDHFITRALKGSETTFLPQGSYWPGHKVMVEDATTLMKRGAHPFLTTRQVGAGRVAWLGVHRDHDQIRRQAGRDLLKRCLVWTQGYALYAEYPNSVILLMDDMGTSEKTYLPYWSYRTPTEEQIRKGLIEPLKRHGAILVQNVCTGFVDRKSQRVLSPWQQNHVVDELVPNRVHDFTSTKRGLDAGVREGVFEIQSHGWTHMVPDLDSPPGPWWTAPMDGVGSYNWYQEFGDPLRQAEVPAIWQAFHLQRSIDYLQADFGVRPLFVMVPGSSHGRSFPNHSARIAAQMGFGLSYFASAEYLGRDLVVSLGPVVGYRVWAFDRPFFEIPPAVDGPYFLVFHDRDLSLDVGWVDRLLRHLGSGVRYMTADEYCAYLHAQVRRDRSAGNSLSLAVEYDDHYCRYFASHESVWTLHLSDETRRSLEEEVPEKKEVRIPKGLGRRLILVGAGGVVVGGER